jgi:RNA polymerase sigma-70 factor (ECF subfamily)
MLASDVTLYADGGGKASAATHPLVGLDTVMKFQESLARIFAQHASRMVRYTFINGLPGFVTVENGTLQTTALLIENGKIAAMYVTRNPDKLQHLQESAIQ